MASIEHKPLRHTFGLFGRKGATFSFEGVGQSERSDMEWHGRAVVLFDDMQAPAKDGYGKEWLKRHFWHPSRVMRAVIDSGITGTDRLQLVDRVADFTLKAYGGGITEGEILGLKSTFKNADLLGQMVTQPLDKTTHRATGASYSFSTAIDLAEKQLDKPPFFLALCHGGLVSTVQTGLYYESLENAGSQLYPVRYSRAKAEDSTPKVSSEELGMFATAASDHTLIVADEDAATGYTMATMVRYLRENIPGADVLGVVNYDKIRSDTKKEETQGLNWEHC